MLYPDCQESMDRLRRAGWLVSDMVVTAAEGPRWVVLGHHGPRSFQAQGATREEAWWRACQDAQVEPPEARANGKAAGPSLPSEEPAAQAATSSPDEFLRVEGARFWVECIAVSPDGRFVATGAAQPIQTEKQGEADFSVRVWDLANGNEVRRFVGHAHWVMSVAFSPDGRRVLSGSYDNTVRLWDVETGKLLHCLRGHEERVRSVAYSPDGRFALSASYDHTLRLWDVETGTEVHCFRGHAHWVMAVAFSGDGRRALSGGFDQTVRLWDVEMRMRWHKEQRGGWFSRIAKLWALRSRRELGRLQGHTANVTSVAFSPDCRRALSGSMDKTVCLWDLTDRKLLHRFTGHGRGVMSVAFSPTGGRALSGGLDNRVLLWDVESGAVLYRYEGHTDVVTSVAFTPDGKQALSGSADKTVRIWQLPP
jgi:WD40 repeat protein